MAEITNIAKANQNPLIGSPASAPAVKSSKNDAKKETIQRTNQAAQKAFKGYECWNKFCKLLKTIGTWIKSIPTKIAEALNRCLALEDDSIDDIEDEDEEYLDEIAYSPLEKIETKIDIDPNLIENLKNNIYTASSYFTQWIIKADEMAISIGGMKFKIVDHLKAIQKFEKEINENLLKIASLKEVLTVPGIDEKISKQAEEKLNLLHDKFNALQNDLKEKLLENQHKIRQLKAAEKIIEAKENERPAKRSLAIEAFEEDIKNKEAVDATKVPTRLFYNNNNCWFHASLQLLWAMGEDFHRMVREKDKDRAALIQDHVNEMKKHEERLAAYRKKKPQHLLDKEKFKAYEIALQKYKNEDLPAYDRELKRQQDAFKEKKRLYEEEIKQWELTGGPTQPPAEPIESQEITVQEPPIPAKVSRPWLTKPSEPVSEIGLLDSLKKLSEAMQAGDRQLIRRVADELLDAIRASPQTFPDLGEVGVQQDAPAFVDQLLRFLLSKPLFIMDRSKEGLEGTQFAGLKKVNQDNMYTLQLEFKSNKSSFQDILEENFKRTPPINDPINAIKMDDPNQKDKVIEVSQYTEKQQISKNQSPPDLFFIHMKRFAAPSLAQIEEEEKAFNKVRNKKISDHAEELKKKAEFKDKDEKEILKAAEVILEHKKQISTFNPDANRSRKISIQIKFPENNIVNFSKAYGIENTQDPDFDYVLCASIIQRGVTQGGHYVANVEGIDCNSGLPRWYHTDNMGGKVDPISSKQALTGLSNGDGNGHQDGYIYFFRRVKKNPEAGA